LEAELDAVKTASSESSGAGVIAAALAATELVEHKNKNSENEKIIEEMKHTLEEQAKASKAREENTLVLVEESNKQKEEMASLVVSHAAATVAIIA